MGGYRSGGSRRGMSEGYIQLPEAWLAAVKNGRVFQLRGMKRTGFGKVPGFGNKSARV